MTSGFVLDGSVAAAWCFADEAGEYTRGVLAAFRNARAYVPELWGLEIANVLLVGERRGRISRQEADRFLALIRSLPILVDQHPCMDALERVLGLARDYSLSAYDAAYLELAHRLGVPLATLDARLASAAQDSGVPRYEPG